ncbi:MAG: hypothetical protein NC084_02865 [Bacteroides sp.]|nr:hypothetical protein [Eubacterium sp.]MCM1417457.1 hypothetical protein [Roseburia sp.]MCM1461637.1 hypothetical protein [Bacteroides sp.]
MEKSTATFLALAAFFCGVTLGLILSPAKNGITIGSHNQIGHKDDLDEYDEDEDDEDDEDYAF